MDAREITDLGLYREDARDMMDLCLYREAEIAFNYGAIQVSPDEKVRSSVWEQCAKCGTWSARADDECPFCFTKWGA